MINKVAPIVPKPTAEGAVFGFTWLSYTGSGMLIAAIISGQIMGFSPMGLITATVSHIPASLHRRNRR
jgi:lactate permease